MQATSYPLSLLLLNQAQVRAADAHATQKTMTSLQLMENAAAHIAQHAQRMLLTTTKKKILVLTGPGNNGGDGFAAARLLQKNHDVTCVATTASLRGDAATMAKKWHGTTLSLSDLMTDLMSDMKGNHALFKESLIIDGLFGTGLTRALDNDLINLIQHINESQSPVLAIDIPSGIDSDSGQVRGAAIRAHRTVTFFARKPAHLLQPGKDYCGAVYVADITAKPSLHAACLRHAVTQSEPVMLRNHPLLWRASLPRPLPQDHKYSRGVCAFHGAQLLGANALATHSALNSGCGMVITTAVTNTNTSLGAQTLAPEVVVRDPRTWRDLLVDTRISVYAMGHGMIASAYHQKLLLETLTILDKRDDKPVLILDGGALQVLIIEKLAKDHPSIQLVLTPHHGEARRCFPDIALDNKIVAAQSMARQTRAIVVLKGNDTVIAAPTDNDKNYPIVINDHAPCSLATAGSGDVLVGVLAALCSAMPTKLMWHACLAGVYLHGEAAYLASRHNAHTSLVASDLPRFLRLALARCAPTHYKVT